MKPRKRLRTSPITGVGGEESESLRPLDTTNQPRLTLVGSGRISNAISASLALNNRELNKQIAELKKSDDGSASLHAKMQKLSDSIVKISILGRPPEDGKPTSESYAVFKKYGIDITYSRTVVDGKEIETKEHIGPDEFEVITTNPQDILRLQNHIFMTIQAQDCDLAAYTRLKPLRSDNTTISVGQNGIPFWLAYKNREGKEQCINPVRDDPIVSEIGSDNLYAAVLNIACQDHKDKEGRLTYIVSTPQHKQTIPVGDILNQHSNCSSKLHTIFNSAGLHSEVTMKGIKGEVWQKLQFNIIVNALSALYDCTIKDLVDKYPLVLETLADEVDNLYRQPNVSGDSKGLRPWPNLMERLERSKGHTTTMCQDYNKGKPIEFEAIYGLILILEDAVKGREFIIPHVRKLAVILNTMLDKRGELMPGKSNVKDAANEARDSVIPLLEKFVSDIGGCVRRPTPLPTKEPFMPHISGTEECKNSGDVPRSHSAPLPDIKIKETPAPSAQLPRLEKVVSVKGVSGRGR